MIEDRNILLADIVELLTLVIFKTRMGMVLHNLFYLTLL